MQIHYGNDRGRCSYSCYGCSFKVSNLKRAKFRRNQVSSQECTEQSPLQFMPRGCYKITFNGIGVKNATATWVPLCIRHVQAASSMNKLVGAEQQAQSATLINLCVPNKWLTSLMRPLKAKERMVVVGGNMGSVTNNIEYHVISNMPLFPATSNGPNRFFQIVARKMQM